MRFLSREEFFKGRKIKQLESNPPFEDVLPIEKVGIFMDFPMSC